MRTVTTIRKAHIVNDLAIDRKHAIVPDVHMLALEFLIDRLYAQPTYPIETLAPSQTLGSVNHRCTYAAELRCHLGLTQT